VHLWTTNKGPDPNPPWKVPPTSDLEVITKPSGRGTHTPPHAGQMERAHQSPNPAEHKILYTLCYFTYFHIKILKNFIYTVLFFFFFNDRSGYPDNVAS